MPRSLGSPLITAGLLLSACAATTTFTSTWKDPTARPVNPVGKTVAAVFVTANEGQRRAAEDVMVSALNRHGARGVAAYTIIPNEGRADNNAANEHLKAAGANGVVVMRVVGKDQQLTYTPGGPAPAYYGRFSGYWGYGWGTVSDPGYLRTDTIISLETLVYSLEQDKLLWAGTSRTTNPDKLDSFINEVADAAANEMIKQGVIVK